MGALEEPEPEIAEMEFTETSRWDWNELRPSGVDGLTSSESVTQCGQPLVLDEKISRVRLRSMGSVISASFCLIGFSALSLPHIAKRSSDVALIVEEGRQTRSCKHRVTQQDFADLTATVRNANAYHTCAHST